MTTAEHSKDEAAPTRSRTFTWVVYCAQFFFGGWFLAHGSNYWLEFFPQPHGSSPIAHELITALIDSGLFAIVKCVEILTGLLLLLNIFVPLAIVLAVPVALSIAQLNMVENNDWFSKITALIILTLIGIMALGYLRHYLPMLRMRNDDPGSDGLHMLFGKTRN